jgi:hypothetical protein
MKQSLEERLLEKEHALAAIQLTMNTLESNIMKQEEQYENAMGTLTKLQHDYAVCVVRNTYNTYNTYHTDNSTLHYTTLHYTTLHYTTLHYTTLHYTTLHYTTLHYTTQHYATLGNTTQH